MASSPARAVDTSAWPVVGVGPQPRLVHDILDQAADQAPHRPALSDGTGTIDYVELRESTLRAAAVLHELGVRPGDRVAATAIPRSEFATLLYAVSRVGAVFVPVHPLSRPFQLKHILTDAAPQVFVRADEDPYQPADVEHVLSWAELAALVGRAVPEPPRPPALTDPTLVFYTSGSSGFPKGVICPHAQVTFAAAAIGARLRYRADDVVFVRLPLAFDYGCHQLFLAALAGAHVVLADPVDSTGLLRRLRAVRATVLPVVPGLARLMLTLAGRDTAPTTLRLITNTGEPLTKRDQEALRSRFPDVALALMYGLTECKRVSVRLLDPDRPPTDSVGTALPGTSVAVLDAERRILPPGAVGEIVVAGPHVAAGYRNAPEMTALRFARCAGTGRRVLFTGDFGSIDEHGELRVIGRADDVFKNSGVRISTLEIETAALDVPGVTGAVAVPPGAPGPAVLWFTGSVSAGELLAGLRGRLEVAKTPIDCRPVDDFPRTANGKIDRRALAGGTETR